jgi:hypothetical protein
MYRYEGGVFPRAYANLPCLLGSGSAPRHDWTVVSPRFLMGRLKPWTDSYLDATATDSYSRVPNDLTVHIAPEFLELDS